MILVKTLPALYQYSAASRDVCFIHTHGVPGIVQRARSRKFEHVTVHLGHQERRIVAWYQSLKLADPG